MAIKSGYDYLEWKQHWDLNAKDAKGAAEGAEEDLCVPLRNPLRPFAFEAPPPIVTRLRSEDAANSV